MCTINNILFPPKHSKWDYSLEIKGNMHVTTVSILVVDENRDVQVYHRVENLPYDKARITAINFCKYYGLNRDRVLVKSFRAYRNILRQMGEGYMMIGIEL